MMQHHQHMQEQQMQQMQQIQHQQQMQQQQHEQFQQGHGHQQPQLQEQHQPDVHAAGAGSSSLLPAIPSSAAPGVHMIYVDELVSMEERRASLSKYRHESSFF
jgi:transcription initiation factor TFIID subunit TAF12